MGASERKTCQELMELGIKSHASGIQDLSTMFNARIEDIEDLTSCLDAGYDDREEKQKEQNQAEISLRTLETTLAEKISSQKKLIEAESISRMQIAHSSLPERHMQLQDLESRVKDEIKTRADTIQKHKTQLEAVCNVVRIGVPLVCFFFLKHMRVDQRTY